MYLRVIAMALKLLALTIAISRTVVANNQENTMYLVDTDYKDTTPIEESQTTQSFSNNSQTPIIQIEIFKNTSTSTAPTSTVSTEKETSSPLTTKAPPIDDKTHTTTTTTEASLTTNEVETHPSDNCPPLKYDLDGLTQDSFLTLLVHRCRYDRLTIPTMDKPMEVFVQIDISHIEVEESYRFKLHLMITYIYIDNRLDYHEISPNRGPIVGGDMLSDKIWTPHIYVPNERASSFMGFGGKDVFVSISPYGKVIYTQRMSVSIYCWMDLKKFPFDEQRCDIYFQTWTYNISKLKLHWAKKNPVIVSKHLHLTEFTLIGHDIQETVNQSILAEGSYLAGNHSCLIFRFRIAREIGYYIMDYFIPSILLVVTSWVTFWLQADAAPPRVTLGTSTMLAFITLASGQAKNLPKVSYIKASEIWFLGCTVFIFLSMAEFAFVNVIWRRKKKVELKKMKSKYILKSAITPKLARKDLQKEWNSLNSLHKSHSCSSLASSIDEKGGHGKQNPPYNHYLTVHSFPSIKVHDMSTNEGHDFFVQKTNDDSISIPVPNKNNNGDSCGSPPPGNFASMTPQEVAMWIDKKSRFIFPCAFLVFNIFYWTFVYAI